jgi:hypothetical protein
MLLIISAGVASADDNLILGQDEPLPCPYCGVWKVSNASRPGMTGEQIIVSEQDVDIPMCGSFSVEELSTKMEIRSGKRFYGTTMIMVQREWGEYCPLEPGKTLMLEANVSATRVDGGRAEFAVSRNDEEQPLLSATGWNYERESPCDSGSGSGSMICLTLSNARLYKALAYEAYAASGIAGPDRFNFNPARYSTKVMEFCEERDAEVGLGSWPSYWELDCQRERLQSKLKEFHSWRLCVEAQSKLACNRPTEKFDRSARQE